MARIRCLAVVLVGLAVAACGDPSGQDSSSATDAGNAASAGPPAQSGAAASYATQEWARVSPAQIEAARRQGVPVAFENDLGMRFVLIPAGSFQMGSPEGEEGRDIWKELGRPSPEVRHHVTLSRSFYMQVTEVANAQFTEYKPDNSGRELGSASMASPSLPAVAVSWIEAKAFALWLGDRDGARTYRLPTEAEWEYACRAATDTPFSTGDALGPEQATFARGLTLPPADSLPRSPGHWTSRPTPCGFYEPNNWGLFDMHGNAQEWCSDWFGEYGADPVVDPRGPEWGQRRILRGGSWHDPPASCRSAARWSGVPMMHGLTVGFRLVSPVISRGGD